MQHALVGGGYRALVLAFLLLLGVPRQHIGFDADAGVAVVGKPARSQRGPTVIFRPETAQLYLACASLLLHPTVTLERGKPKWMMKLRRQLQLTPYVVQSSRCGATYELSGSFIGKWHGNPANSPHNIFERLKRPRLPKPHNTSYGWQDVTLL